MRGKIDKNYFILILLGILMVIFITPKKYLFGSMIDWFPQHIMFPDYFRQNFYETGNLFPNFTLALGAGQNIFHFSYYGLFNPFVLLSYFFPFIEMTTYIIVVNIILYIASALLSYKWLKRHFDPQIALLVSILFLCASPILFHFHRHFMFVSYMPFLFIGLIGIEDYFHKGKKVLLTLSTLGIILMSYFYSIPSLLVFVLYGIYCYIKKEKKITVSKFIKDGFFFLIPLLHGILLSSFFLLPTFFTVISGRGSGDIPAWYDLFLPKMNAGAILYDHYSMGLTSIAVFSLLYGFIHKKRENRFLAITLFALLCLPFVSYVLNGMLYIRNKVFIPFIPLVLYEIATFLKDLKNQEVPTTFYSFSLFSCLLIFIWGYHFPFYYLDAFLTLILIYFLSKKKNQKIFYLFLIIPIGTLIFTNHIDHFVSKDLYQKAIESPEELNTILNREENIVRTYHLPNSLYNTNKIYGKNYYVDSVYSSIYNEDYQYFYKDIFKNPRSYRNKMTMSQNNNLLYQMFMGGKYMYHTKDMIGYKKIKNHIYQNDEVLPMFYVTDHLLSEKEFDLQKYPYTVLSLLKNTVVKGKSKNVRESYIEKDIPSYHISERKNLMIKENNGKYQIKALEKNKLVLELDKELRDQIVLIDFIPGDEHTCEDGDSVITINGNQNTLTCNSAIYKNQNRVFHYILAEPKLKTIKITFSKGNYSIKDIHMYLIDYNEIKDINKNIIPVKMRKVRKKDGHLKGSVEVEKEGYFVTSIPYDKGFTIFDNGKKISYEKVNKAFLGFKVKKGVHNIEIKYHAKGFFIGKCLSIIGFFLLVFVLYKEKNHKIKRKDKIE